MATYEQRLQQITGGRVPEEGDFNTASLTASDTPPSVRRDIQAELRSVECCDPDQEALEARYPSECVHIVNGVMHDGLEQHCTETICSLARRQSQT